MGIFISKQNTDMKLELTLNSSIKVKKEIIQKLKNNRKNILNKINNNEEKEEIDKLTLYQTELSEDLINIKDALIRKNIELGINKLIYTLSECKELIITYEKLINSTYKKEKKQEEQDKSLIESYQSSIDKLKDKVNRIETKLEEINSTYTIEIELYSDSTEIEKIN